MAPTTEIVFPDFDLTADKQQLHNMDDFASFDMSNNGRTAISKGTAATAQESFATPASSGERKKLAKQKLSQMKNPDAYTKEVLNKMMNESERDFVENGFGGFGDFDEDPFDEPDFATAGSSSAGRSDPDLSTSRRSNGSSKNSKKSKKSKDSKKSSSAGKKKKKQQLIEQQLEMQRLLLHQQQEQMNAMQRRMTPEQMLDHQRYNSDIVANTEDDDVSVMSDLTGLTGAFHSQPSQKSFATPTTMMSSLAPSAIEEEASQEDSHVSPYDNCRHQQYDYGSSNQLGLQQQQRSNLQPKRKPSKAVGKKQVKKEINFSTICIHHHERILVENPGTQLGPSIGIGWRATHDTMNLRDYEGKREPFRRNILLDKEQREKMLMELGYSQKEIANAVRNITKARNQRRQTAINVQAEKAEEAFEGTAKRLSKLFKRGSS